MFKFETVNSDEYEQFNAYISNSPYGNLRQTTYWGEIKSLSGWDVQYYALKKKCNIVGVASVFIRKLPYVPLSLMYCCRGPVVDWNDPDCSKAILKGLSLVVRQNHGACLRIDPEPIADTVQQEKLFVENGFSKLNIRVTQWNRSLYSTRVYLNGEEDQLFSNMRRTHRQNINKAIRLGVSVCIEKTSNDKDDFFQLMNGLESRRNSIIHEKDYYDKVYENIVNVNTGYFIKAKFEGKIISGLVVSVLKDKAWALFVANDYVYRNLMPNKLLLWEAIKLTRNIGCKFLDFGATQGTEDFDPVNDSLDMLKQAYNPEVIRFPGYYDFKGSLYTGFRLVENNILPNLIGLYYKINRTLKL